jgi:hypothetical protein
MKHALINHVIEILLAAGGEYIGGGVRGQESCTERENGEGAEGSV